MSAWPRPLDLSTQHDLRHQALLASFRTIVRPHEHHHGAAASRHTACESRKLPLPPPRLPMIHFDDSSVTTKTKARRRTAGKATGRVVSRVRVLPLVGVRFGPELGTGPASEWDGSDVTNKLAASWCCLQVATEIGGASRSQRGKWTGKQDEFENVGLWMKY